MPADLTYEEAAPCTEGSSYALGLIDPARIEEGQDVLVYGATGAIGSSAVQLLKCAGARVTAVCATPHLRPVRDLGADRVVDYTVGDFTTDAQRYDVVFDAVGKTTFGRCRRLLKPRGRFLASDGGPYWQNVPLAVATPLLRGRRVAMPVSRAGPAAVRRVKGLIESGRFRAVIDRCYPLDQIVEAYRYVDTGRKVGGVVILVAGSR
jgi:NADPH:quinone reductase-like Zn-dependent oxidoreductase